MMLYEIAVTVLSVLLLGLFAGLLSASVHPVISCLFALFIFCVLVTLDPGE